MFTRQHYKAIAKIIEETKSGEQLWDGQANRIAIKLIDYFATDNPRFDREKFLTACGLQV